jgi:hypothetical protein
MRVRQLIPTKFATAYREGDEHGQPVFVTWWMLFGRCYKVRRTAI